MSLMDKIKKLFARQEIPRDARDLVREATELNDVLRGLDELITRNEMAVNDLTSQMESLESVEGSEMDKIRGGELPDRSKNNVLRKIQRIRKQMDNLEERQQIYNRNINLQVHLVGRIQALEAMELRGVDEDRIDSILAEYEEELTNYQSVLDTEEIATGDLVGMLDDSSDLQDLESEILNEPAEATEAPTKGSAKAPDVPTPQRAADSAAPTSESAPAARTAEEAAPRQETE